MLTKGARFGSWVVVELDGVGKRAMVECNACGGRLMAGAESLIDGSFRSCDCRKSTATPVQNHQVRREYPRRLGSARARA
jgi:hypothetical protein